MYFENLAEAAATEPLPIEHGRRRAARLPRSAIAASCTRSSGPRRLPTHWEVLLRCPNCEWNDVGVYDQTTVDRFDDELDRGTEALMRDLKRLTQANMEDEIERFVLALAADAILPEDF